jgi:hypothetical protein
MAKLGSKKRRASATGDSRSQPSKRTAARKRPRKPKPVPACLGTASQATIAYSVPEDPLTPIERRFALSYMLHNENAAAAYRDLHPGCSYGTACTNGSEMANRPHVKAEIAAARQEIFQKLQLNAEHVLREIQRIAFADPAHLTDADGVSRSVRDVPLSTRRALSKVQFTRERVTSKNKKTEIRESVRTYQLCDKLQALDKLAGYLGLKNTELPEQQRILQVLVPDPEKRAKLASILGMRPAAENKTRRERAADAMAAYLGIGVELPEPQQLLQHMAPDLDPDKRTRILAHLRQQDEDGATKEPAQVQPLPEKQTRPQKMWEAEAMRQQSPTPEATTPTTPTPACPGLAQAATEVPNGVSQ